MLVSTKSPLHCRRRAKRLGSEQMSLSHPFPWPRHHQMICPCRRTSASRVDGAPGARSLPGSRALSTRTCWFTFVVPVVEGANRANLTGVVLTRDDISVAAAAFLTAVFGYPAVPDLVGYKLC